MNAQQLKNSILQMAVQGKLVPQDPNDEPASVLLERIRAEKEKLIKDGKIKKEKNPSYIFRGEDNLPYEKIGKNEPVCIADEVPFEIPDSWEWVRFKNLVNYFMGKTPPRKESEYWEKPSFPWVSIADMIDGEVINNSKEQVNQFSFDNVYKGRISPAGTLLMSFKLTVGKVSVLGMDAFHNEAIISIYPYISDNNITRDFLFETLPLLSKAGDTKAAIKGNTLNSDSLDALFIPLPPINEQLRITRKLQELKKTIADYDVLEKTSSKLAEDFPESLKKSILQQAVMGKLVPQDSNDEPASVLLERIRAEKQALIKSGKLKKDKHESIIYRRDNSHYEITDGVECCIDEEIPFDVPENWIWCRLWQICLKITDGSHNPPPICNEGYRVISAKNIKKGHIVFYPDDRFANQEGFDKENQRTNISKNDVILGIIGGSIGNTAIYSHDDRVIAQRSIAILKSMINQSYLKVFLDSPYIQAQFSSKAAGTAQGGIYLGELANLLIPLPPLAEQERILLQLEPLLSCIETL